MISFHTPQFLALWQRQAKGSERRAENKVKTLFSAFYPEPQPTLGEAKVVQGERNAKFI